MVAIRVDAFKGLAPAISPIKLADGAATTALNARVEGSSLVPERQPTTLEALPTGTKAFYKWLDQYWLTSVEDESFVESPVVTDTWKRVYMAGGDYPRYTAYQVALSGYSATDSIADNPTLPTTSYRLGIPSSDNSVSVSVTGTADADTADIEKTTAYVFTYVTDYGEEGPPSEPSNLVTFFLGQTRSLQFPSNPSGNYAFSASGAKKRVYRTATGTSNTEYLFVGETNFSATTFTDSGTDADLGEVLPTEGHFRPLDDDTTYAPDGPLQKIVLMPGGFLAGFAGKNVAFSEPYLPHAWNPANTLVTESNIVTIISSTFGLVVLTETRPYVAVGNTPEAMSIVPLDINQACVSAKSAADLGGQVIYASPDGLVSIQGNQTQLITDGLITRRQWQAYEPETMLGVTFEGRYYAFYDDGTNERCLVYDQQATDAPLMEIALHATAAHVSAKDDILYLKVGNNLVTFGTDDTYEMTWKSKKYFLPVDTTLAWGRVVADGRVQLRIYIDGVKIFDRRVEDSLPFRLPPRTRGREVELEIVESTKRIDSIAIGSERSEV